MVKNSGFLAILTIALLPACRREALNESPDTPPPSVPSAPVVPAPTTTSTTDHAEVFRRAFWRQPTSADRILNAERRVSPDDNSWQWFIQLHPSPALLAALREPDTFGLMRVSTPRQWPAQPPPPEWFPAQATLTPDTFEIRQAPSTGLTVLYRVADDLLFATDSGAGFALPAR